MTTPLSDDDLRLELDIVARKAGLTIPADRHDAVLTSYKELKRMTALMRQPRGAAAEPSNIYSLVGSRRGGRHG
ncbi:hypothetical protein FHP25_33925 [Vineibacter terrae]|uniref:Uncharacterized protein n=1 Tax=Vineibacter terrae TaxID=2586908 RepID=A0A5C8PBA2_9HYPH|nr:hypothetical protein [Vineibacter terrae]TXL70536.1 hypothetical protein FHP25_33925 [Vineibacter terrae]